MKDSDWQILCELHKNPNITKVANLMYITQPSITKRLQYMESKFEITIVNRTPKGLNFTPEGEYLAKRAEKYIEFINETKEQLKKMKKKSEKVITIGSSYTYSKYTLTDILVEYKKHYPNVEFEIVNDQSNLLFRKVIEENIDVAFIRGDYKGEVKKVLIGRNQAYLVTKGPQNINELPNMLRINYKTNDHTIELLDEWWRDYFEKPVQPGMTVGYIDFAWQLIDKGLGYTCCFLPDNFENEFNLHLTPLTKKDGSKIMRNTWFIYPKSQCLTETLEKFILYIKKESKIKNDL